MKAIRWSDNDRYFGPFTYARGRYRALGVSLESGSEDYPGCRIMVRGFGHTLICRLPQIIRPAREWHEITTEPTRSRIIAQGREPGYWETWRRDYGFSFAEGALHVHYGAQTHEWPGSASKCYFLPWTQWRHVRHSFYDLDGEHFYTVPDRPWRGMVGGNEWHNRWAAENAIRDACPTASFELDDFDGERLIVTTRIEEREWLFGTGLFKWLSLFRRPKIRRSLDISFSGETGKRKGSWKGGTIGTGIDMLPGELHESAFRRYCLENEMTFVPPVGAAA